MSMQLPDTNSRYHRQELITWWDQGKLLSSRVLVVGAGAIGNEVAKNLALVGVGHVEICDMDTIEHSNLARCVFFRDVHEGLNKATVLAQEIATLNPDIEAVGHGVAVQRLGVGYLRQFDIVIGALDNREARAWVNQACRKLGKYWIDGAIEGLRGLVRIFGPEGPCYACTLTEADYKQMSHRKSCALLAPEEILSGKTPTNATTAAIVAGIQVQEAIKFLTDNQDLMSVIGKVWSYTGDSMDVFVSKYQEDDYCLSHDYYETILDQPVHDTLASAIDQAASTLGEDPVAVDFEDDLITVLPCTSCGSGDTATKLRSAFELGEGRCDNCGIERVGEMVTSVPIDSPVLELPVEHFGFPLLDMVTIRGNTNRVAVVISGGN
jgi:molybdopterin/thiamine biosynthesis adenylyltransferase